MLRRSSGAFARGTRHGVSTSVDLALLYLPPDDRWGQGGILVTVTGGVGYDLY